MPDVKWTIKGREFVNCNCSYSCPCQFNGLPTHNFCEAVGAFQIDHGSHGSVSLDGLKFVGIFRWPGPIHEGKGEAAVVVDARATPEQRAALLRIVTGQDTKPGATIFQVFSTTFEKVHEPVFADITFEVDVEGRKARLVIPGITEGHGEPVVNPVTGQETRARIHLPDGFEYTFADVGRGWNKVSSPFPMNLSDTYGQFAHIHMTQDGVVR